MFYKTDSKEIECLLEALRVTIYMLPKLMCDEMEKREEIRKELRTKRLQEQMDFYKENMDEINKFMFGVDAKAGEK
jgi:hypothetical protein